MQFIRGTQQVINRLTMEGDKFLAKIGEAVEKTCVDVSNHAKAGHQGNMAHATKRYQNQTSTLTRSITPELKEVSYKGVKGIVFTNMEYALYVELKYPFLYPAMMANKKNYEDRLKRALRR